MRIAELLADWRAKNDWSESQLDALSESTDYADLLLRDVTMIRVLRAKIEDQALVAREDYDTDMKKLRLGFLSSKRRKIGGRVTADGERANILKSKSDG